MELVTSLLVCLLLVLMKKLWSLTHQSKHPRLPGPPTLEAFRSLLNTSSTKGLHARVSDWAGVYGDIVALNLPGQAIVFLNNADHVKEVFTSDANKAVSNDRQGTFATKFVFDDQSLGFLSLGVEHTRMRRLFASTLRHYGEGVPAYEDQAREELYAVVKRLGGGGRVDMKDLLSESLMNCIHVLLMGHRAAPDSPSFLAMLEFNSAMNAMLRYELDATLTMFPFLRHVPGYYKYICDNVQTSKAKLLRLLFNEVKNSSASLNGNGYICRLLQEQRKGEAEKEKEGGQKRNRVTDDQIKFLILDILNAGYMTTRGALLGIVLCLVNYPDVQQNMYMEIKAHCGERDVTLEDRSNLPYVEAVLMEVLRYTSHTPFSVPHLTRGDVGLAGFTIPRGSLVVANLWGIHHDDRVFGDSWKFRPERYLDEDGLLLPKDHPIMRKSMPFSTGKRQCPGASFATSRLYLYIATLAQRFQISPQNGVPATSADPRTWRPGIILHLPEILCNVKVRD